MINTKKNQNLLAVNGDLFDGEKVSQLTSSTFGQDSESESEKEHKRKPGDLGTSLPVMDSNLVSPFHNDPSDGDAPTSGLHPDLRHQTTDEHDDEEEDEQIHFVNVYRAKIN